MSPLIYTSFKDKTSCSNIIEIVAAKQKETANSINVKPLLFFIL